MITAEYLVTHCRYWDGTSDYYDRLMNMAEECINLIDEPTISGFEIYINSSLKFEIKAKQFYAASQRVL